VTHCASSVSHGERYGDLFKKIIFPYWAANPPSKRFTSGPYKPYDHWTAFLPAAAPAFKILKAYNTAKFLAISKLLSAAGHPALAKQVWQGWKVYALYNNPALDFDIFYCVARADAIERALPADEQSFGAPHSGDRFQMCWRKGSDEWAAYLLRHADVVRAKFFAERPKKGAKAAAGPPPLPTAAAAPARPRGGVGALPAPAVRLALPAATVAPVGEAAPVKGAAPRARGRRAARA